MNVLSSASNNDDDIIDIHNDNMFLYYMKILIFSSMYCLWWCGLIWMQLLFSD